jgi:pyruvate,water dikinase
VPYTIDESDVSEVPATKTKMMMILGNPHLAFDLSHLPNSGIGLVRMEFMIMNHIKVHPLALLNPEVLTLKEQAIVAELTRGYPSVQQYFVDKLAEGIAMIASAFHPHDVVLRFSDFKSNEYANLIGGQHFEPAEENPMLGWRGASRYYDEKYKLGFELECEAVKKVRNVCGLTNLVVMIPFLRTVSEASKVIATMASYGLKQGENGLRVYGMCEVPSNVILAHKFLQILDGFSIGSNDLTQLTLGIDRDSEIVSHLYDERNEAVTEMFTQVISAARAAGKYIGICGQAPSDYPELCELLVRCGITSIALNPDTILKATMQVAKIEKDL